jgi:hypothetical protein
MSRIFEIWRYLFFIGYGIYALLGGLFPPDPKDDPSFYHWENDAYDGPTISFMGFSKQFGRKRILAQGTLTPHQARVQNITAGLIALLIGTFAILYHFQLPPFAPDNF